MDIIQTLILALIQGITEFLPISSSAHLILPAQIFNWPDQGLAFDVAVHLGSLIAVLTYFRQDISKIIISWFGSLPIFKNAARSEESDFAWLIILATLPTIFFGWIAKDWIELNLRTTNVIAFSTIFFAFILAFGELKSRQQNEVISLTWKIALIIGIAQVFALIPGTSRSGITISIALILGLSKTTSAKFSFLLSIPVILAASLLSSFDLLNSSNSYSLSQILIALIVSSFSAYLCISWFMGIINRIGLMPFVWYLIILGLFLFIFI
jgi:undecaprenyl-diphosphatase